MAKGSGGTRPIGKSVIIPNEIKSEDFAQLYLNDSSISTEERAAKVFSIIRNDIETTGKSSIHPFKMSEIENDVAQEFEALTGESIINKDIYSSVKALTHHQGGKKALRGKELSWVEKESIPGRLSKMDIYENEGSLIYTDYNIKVVIHPNEKIKIDRKRTIVANHISASRVLSKTEFGNKVYRLLKKKIL